MPGPTTRRRAPAAALLLLAILVLGCAGAATAPEETEASSPRPEAASGGQAPPKPGPEAAEAEARRRRKGSDALVLLGEEALSRGELDKAGARFDRVLASRPDSVRARLGAARVARAMGEREAARAHLERALAAEPDAPAALLELARLEAEAGREGRARELLEASLRRDFLQPAVHAELQALTGPAPRGEPPSPEAAVERAAAHPYDPRALVDAGVVLAAEDRGAEAARFFEKALWLADLDPVAGREAARRLPEVDAAWQDRRVVPVHAFADETVRGDPSWAFRLRLLWLGASRSLEPVLRTRFAVVRLMPLGAGTGPMRLQPWFEGLVARTATLPEGIVAGFTERPPPPAPPQRLGVAHLLGRHMAVRLEPGEVASRVLAHEILHVYGAIHVPPEIDSLMNPSGDSRRLDGGNQQIVHATRGRRFRGRGLEADVLETTDLDTVLGAYEKAVSVNLLFRRAGIAEALEASGRSRVLAAREVRRATGLDSHLAEVASTLARLLLLDGRRGEALLMLDAAARLYQEPGPAREARARADALARALEAEYGAPGGGS
jgi:tetratricopeptide (TPR) repeat protein